MVLVMTRPTRDPKSGIWEARKGVPNDLRAIVGVRELKRSLGTKDDAEARRRAPPVIAEFEARIAAAREQYRGAVASLAPAEVAALVGAWYRVEAAKIDAAPGEADRRDAVADVIEAERGDPEDGDVIATADDREAADALLAARGIAADAATRRLAGRTLDLRGCRAARMSVVALTRRGMGVAGRSAE